ncbi:cellulase family glycosylhydrolase, partial [Streptococcus pyogenes]|uniref:cellulase family glycosylhydrolase n=1 Tax=Streptococcus pyogenes TaxID=1314 RepID=UPI001C7283EE
MQSPGAERLGDPRYIPVMRDYVTSVMTQFRNDDRVLGWDLWNEPDNPARQYRNVERSDKEQLVANLLPQVFRWARAVDASQPLTSGVWRGDWGQPQGRSAISDIQLANADVITFHSYAEPTESTSQITYTNALNSLRYSTSAQSTPTTFAITSELHSTLYHALQFRL